MYTTKHQGAYVIKINTREVFDLAVALVVFGDDVAKTFRGEDFDDDDAIAKEHHRKWNECAQSEVHPVPRSKHERQKVVPGVTDHIGVCDISTFGDNDFEVCREEEVHIGAKQQQADDRPRDNNAST